MREVAGQVQAASLELIPHIRVSLPLNKQTSEALQIIFKEFSLKCEKSIVIDVIDVCSELLNEVKSII